MISKDPARSIPRLALGIYGKSVLCMVISAFIFISITAVFTGIFTKTIGQYTYYTDDDGQYLKDENGDPIRDAVYFDEETDSEGGKATTGTTTATGTTTTQKNTTTVSIRSELDLGMEVLMYVIVQLFAGACLVALLYSSLWMQGNKDGSRAQQGRQTPDAWRGLKAGLIACVPSAVLYIAYVVMQFVNPTLSDTYTALYTWLNAPLLPILNACGSIGSAVVRTLLMVLPLLVTPAICALAYQLGYRDISLQQKFFYVNPKKRKKD